MPVLEEPRPEQFGLTTDRVARFKSIEDKGPPLLGILIGLLGAVAINIVLPRSLTESVHILWRLILAFLPGFYVGVAIEERSNREAKAQADYERYVKYSNAMKAHSAALKAHSDLLRKIRHQESKRRRAELASERAKQEWWRHIDGRGFELEVAKILLAKGYQVEHTGSSFGDGGVDLVLRTRGKKIIVQCKAHKNYLSPGVVRELYGTLVHEHADEGWLAISGFYAGAKSFAAGKPIRLVTIRELMALPNLTL